MTNAVNLASAAGTGFFRNRIINGDMRIDQRNAGASVSVASGAIAYAVDRNGVYNGGTNAITAQQVAGAAGFQNALRISGSASNLGVSWYQRIEAANTFDLASVTMTFSAWVWASSARNITTSISTPNSFENFFSQTVVGGTTWSVTTTPTRFSWTFTMPANAVNGGEVAIQLGVLLAGQTVTITGVQLEAGSVATPFERRSFQVEYNLCRRYYEKSYNLSMVPGTADTSHLFTTSPDGFSLQPGVVFSVEKRTTPTVTLYSTNGASGNIRRWDSSNQAAGAGHLHTNGFLPQGAGITSNVFYAFHWTADAEL